MKSICHLHSLFVSIVSVAIFSSCSLMYFANPGLEPVVFTKPLPRDTAFTTNYVGAKYSNTHYSNMYDEFNVNNYGQAYIYQTLTKRLISSSYGTFAYLGSMKINDVINTPPTVSNKSFFGLGATADIQLNLTMDRFVLRPIGYRVSSQYENGEFARYKETYFPGFGEINNFVSTSFSQTFGAEYFFRKSSLAFNTSVGFETTLPFLLFDVGYTMNVVYTTPKLSVYLQKSGFGFLKNEEVAVGVSYRLR